MQKINRNKDMKLIVVVDSEKRKAVSHLINLRKKKKI